MSAPLKRLYRLSALMAILLLGVLLRLNLSVKAFFSTFDTSTVGLMAMHILEGERPLFYYGQNYMGALEAYVAAAMFALFGVSTTSLSLSPILFSAGWIVAMYFLFHELLGLRAGLAAALCTAAGGWYTMWFSMGTYGGYSNTFFFGTVFLCLALRLAGRDLSTAARWSHAAGMGIMAALGVWTNFQVFSYLVTGGLVLLAGMVPAQSRRLLIKPVLAAIIVSLAGFIPLIKHAGGIPSTTVDWGGISIAAVPGHAVILLEMLPKLFIWPVDTPELLLKLSIATWLTAAFLYLVKIATEKRRKEQFKLLVPLLFTLVFLIFYLIHPLAASGATRYLVPLASILTAAVFGGAVSHKWRTMRWAGYILLTFWTLFNTASILQTAEVRSQTKRDIVLEREGLIRQAEEKKLRHLMILGSHTDGHYGQSLTFYARDRVRYVSSTLERYYPSLLSAESDPRTGFIFKEKHLPKVKDSLRSAGITSYGEARLRWITLYDLAVPHTKNRSILPGEMKVEVEGGVEDAGGKNLVDRRAGTSVEPARGMEEKTVITVILNQPRRIGTLWLTAADSGRLPVSFGISTSTNGIEFTPVGQDFRDILPTYIAGNRVYMMGYYARNELRFNPVEALYVRITIGRNADQDGTWSVNELFLFEDEGPATAIPDEEVEEIARILKNKEASFTVADRWLSAQLGGSDRGLTVFPPFNPHFKNTIMSRRFAPHPGLAVVVERAMAQEAEESLKRANLQAIPLQRTDLPHYTLFIFSGVDSGLAIGAPTLEWNGHAVLEARSSAEE